MNIKTILAKLALRPAVQIFKVMDWMLSEAEAHWAAEANKHHEAMHRNHGTSLGAKAEAAYSDAFDNWQAIRIVRSRIAKVPLLGGRQLLLAA